MKVPLKIFALAAAFFSFASAAGAAQAAGGPLAAPQPPSTSSETSLLSGGDARTPQALLAEALDGRKDAASRCAAVEALTGVRNDQVSKELAGLLGDGDPAVRACAIRAAGESRNDLAVDPLLENVEAYLALPAERGPYEKNLAARLKAIDSIWSLGQIGDPRLMARLADFYAGSDQTIKINVLISIGKLRKNAKAGPFLSAIAAAIEEPAVVRAAAYEMLEELGLAAPSTTPAPSKIMGIENGDLIYTGGITGTISGWVSPILPIGHAGIFAGGEIRNRRIYVVIADCVPNNFKPGGVRNISSWKNFTHEFMYPYYGNRSTSPRPTAEQRKRIVALALSMGKKGLKYNFSHTSQKGPVVFDCVGYTEYLYETAGLNPTPDTYETGIGWPLTPYEQFSVTISNSPSGGPALVAGSKTPDQSIITGNFTALTGAFGLNGVTAPQAAADILPASAN